MEREHRGKRGWYEDKQGKKEGSRGSLEISPVRVSVRSWVTAEAVGVVGFGICLVSAMLCEDVQKFVVCSMYLMGCPGLRHDHNGKDNLRQSASATSSSNTRLP